MFNGSKYSTWYFKIIENASSQNRKKSTDSYFESHHIIPKSLGGDNSKANLVLLTAREHFIAHWLLTKMVDGKDRYRMASAFIAMSRSNNAHKREYSPRQYEVMRKVFSKATTERMTGRVQTDDTKKKIGAANRGKVRSDDARKNMAKAQAGRNHSETTKDKIRSANIGNTNGRGNKGSSHSDETKRKLSERALQREYGSDHAAWNRKEYSFVDPEGNLHHVTNMKDFCSKHGLQPRNMYALSSGKLTKYRKWRSG